VSDKGGLQNVVDGPHNAQRYGDAGGCSFSASNPPQNGIVNRLGKDGTDRGKC
jgi:hypothetical protein